MPENDYDWNEHLSWLDVPASVAPAPVAPELDPIGESCSVLNNALRELMDRVYNWGEDAVAFDGRLVCGTPMGKKGHKEYGLTPTEREILRNHLLLRSLCSSSRPWLYYNEQTRAWYANIEERPFYESALAWLMRNQVNPFFYLRAKVASGSK